MGTRASKSVNKEEKVNTSKTKLINKENDIQPQQQLTYTAENSRSNHVKSDVQKAWPGGTCTNDDIATQRSDDLPVRCNRSFNMGSDELDGERLPGVMNRNLENQPGNDFQPSHRFIDTGNRRNTNLPSIPGTSRDKKDKKKKKKGKNNLQPIALFDGVDKDNTERSIESEPFRPSRTRHTERPVLSDVDDHSNEELTFEIQKLKEEKRSLEFKVDVMALKTTRLEMICRGKEQYAEEEDKSYICPARFLNGVNFIQSHVADLNREISRLRNESNEYLNRLSSVAGSRLTDNNPNITNLNDPNRPGKIAEQYNEIYDNDWTDALQDLQKQLKHIIGDDELYVYHLYSLIKVIYRSCKEKAELQIHGLAVNMFLMNNPSTQQLDAMWQNYPSQRQKVNEGRKHTADIGIQMLQQTLIEDAIFQKELRCCNPPLDDAILTVLSTHPYFQKCVEVCWQIVIQDPPMYLETSSLEGTHIDKDSYRLYTTSGLQIKYVVWPALYLHYQGHKGPVMAKGVVQPVKLGIS